MAERYAVVIPAFNAVDTLADAIDSILAQSVPPVDLIVVDDGSTDGTADLAQRYGGPVRLLSQPNRGCGAATNAGIDAVDVPVLAFLDADDIWLAGKAERQLAGLRETPEVAGLFGHACVFRGDPATARRSAPVELWGRTTLMMRTEAARSIGPMIDPPGGRGDTIDWIARGREAGLRFDMLPEVLALRRIRPGSLSSGRDAEKDRGYLSVIRQALERRRAREREAGDGA